MDRCLFILVEVLYSGLRGIFYREHMLYEGVYSTVWSMAFAFYTSMMSTSFRE